MALRSSKKHEDREVLTSSPSQYSQFTARMDNMRSGIGRCWRVYWLLDTHSILYDGTDLSIDDRPRLVAILRQSHFFLVLMDTGISFDLKVNGQILVRQSIDPMRNKTHIYTDFIFILFGVARNFVRTFHRTSAFV